MDFSESGAGRKREGILMFGKRFHFFLRSSSPKICLCSLCDRKTIINIIIN